MGSEIPKIIKKSSLESIFIAALFYNRTYLNKTGDRLRRPAPFVEGDGSLYQSGMVEFQNVFLGPADLS